jgi:putative FmdB family regulatory protein
MGRNHCIFAGFFTIMRRSRESGKYLMPIYEYRCENCAHEHEVIQKISDPLLQTCPACEKDALVKKISASGFRLKGGGWYETDFKSGNKRNVSGGEDGGDKPAAKESSAGTDTKKSESAQSKKSGDSKPKAESS